MNYQMFNKEMYVSKTVHESSLEAHLNNGYIVLYKCAWNGTPF